MSAEEKNVPGRVELIQDADAAYLDGPVVFSLGPAEWDAFTAALNAPPKEIPELRKLFARKPLWNA